MKFMYLLALLLLAYSVNCRPELEEEDYDENYPDDDNNDTNNTDSNEYDEFGADKEDEEINSEPPVMDTVPQQYMAKENQTLYLPCSARNSDMYVKLWKKDNVLLTQGSIVFVNQVKVEVMKNGTLIIKNVNANDSGSYTCELPYSKKELINVTHQVFVESAPVIKFLKARDDVVQLKAGDTLSLTCNATGFPKPEIKWFFQNSSMEATGETLTIDNIVHDAAGFYRCLADNKVGRPAHQSIEITIIHKPKVQTEKMYVDGVLHEIRCVVHATPQATVSWKWDGVHLKSTPSALLKQKGNFHRLIFKHFDKSHFGEYACSARNDIGEVENIIVVNQLSDKPHLLPKIKEHVIEWSVPSYSPIREALVYYKNKADAKWSQNEAAVHKDGENKYKINFNFNDLHLRHGNYEAKLKVKLGDGSWSQFSDVKEFMVVGHTQQHHHKQRVSFNTDDAAIDEADLHADNTSNIALKDQEGSVIAGPRVSDDAVSLMAPMTLLLITTGALLA